MCEYCADFRTWGIPLHEAERTECERMTEEPDDYWACGQPATWRVYVRHAERHLCPMHLAHEDRRIDEAGGAFLGSFGVQASVDFLPIRTDATCDHVDSPWEGPKRRCGRPATHVKMVTEEWLRCDEHAARVGFRRN